MIKQSQLAVIHDVFLAISRGPQVIEKYFTLDKTSDFIRDHALSAEPNELKNLIIIRRQIYKKTSIGI